MSLAGKTALVTGGSGTVGAGVLDQLVHAGATVIVPLRGSKDSVLQSLGDVDVSKLDFVSANVGDEKSVVKLAEYINQKYGSIDHVVTSVGGWWQKGDTFSGPAAAYLQLTCCAVLDTIPAMSGFTFDSGSLCSDPVSMYAVQLQLQPSVVSSISCLLAMTLMLPGRQSSASLLHALCMHRSLAAAANGGVPERVRHIRSAALPVGQVPLATGQAHTGI